MSTTKMDDLPELIGTPGQVRFAERIRRSMLAVARHNRDHATIEAIMATRDSTKFIAAHLKNRPLTEYVRVPDPMDTPEVAALRARLSAPWWLAARATMRGDRGPGR
jgi:hypothetical protein